MSASGQVNCVPIVGPTLIGNLLEQAPQEQENLQQ